ncbi:DUF6745 domain-containing protein [Nonomuraea sp. NPDC023979]|uniref:DUF6745 domain-containing protein n=1 Tax=Nonomuraea sp. NPDC023979 TaxID=3154796 RepID=UPI0033E99C7E
MHTDERVAWERMAFATGPGGDADAAVRQAYREAGLPEPDHVIVVASPLAGARAAAWLTADPATRPRPAAPNLQETARTASETPEGQAVGGSETPARAESSEGAGVLAGLPVGVVAGRSVRHEVRTLPWERARAALSAELGPAGWAARWEETGGRLWPQVSRLVADVRRAIAEAATIEVTAGSDTAAADGSQQVGEELRRVTLDAVLGQHDAPWLSAFEGLGGLDGLERVARCASWWWPYERVAIVSARPAELHLDELGRLHAADGPALVWSDGFALHAWHGMPVPAGFTMTDLTPARIREESNAELRRVMLEHFGVDRYLAESGARPEHSDETGVLWRIELPGDEPVAMVEVVNSTPEPDGTRRTYFLRVPPWVRRAREGVAWTFGVSEESYRPERET